jgi:hypothetical protein
MLSIFGQKRESRNGQCSMERRKGPAAAGQDKPSSMMIDNFIIGLLAGNAR